MCSISQAGMGPEPQLTVSSVGEEAAWEPGGGTNSVGGSRVEAGGGRGYREAGREGEVVAGGQRLQKCRYCEETGARGCRHGG